jgi:hypothetical protein
MLQGGSHLPGTHPHFDLLLIENSNKSKQFQSELTSDHHVYT